MQYHISSFLLSLSMVQNNRCGNGVGSTKGKKQRGKGANGKHATNKKGGRWERRKG